MAMGWTRRGGAGRRAATLSLLLLLLFLLSVSHSPLLPRAAATEVAEATASDSPTEEVAPSVEAIAGEGEGSAGSTEDARAPEEAATAFAAEVAASGEGGTPQARESESESAPSASDSQAGVGGSEEAGHVEGAGEGQAEGSEAAATSTAAEVVAGEKESGETAAAAPAAAADAEAVLDLKNKLMTAIESGQVRVYVQTEKAERSSGSSSVSVEEGLDSFERNNHFVVGIANTKSNDDSIGNEAAGGHPREEATHRRVEMTSHQGLRLECFLPIVSEPSMGLFASPDDAGASPGGEGSSTSGGVSSGARPLVTDEASSAKYLGQGMINSCHTKTVGWWTYEVCPLSHVKQYHEENGQVLSSFNLGFINTEKTWNLTTDAAALGFAGAPSAGISADTQQQQQRSISFVYDSGTQCDLNGLPREAVVKFSCSPTGRDGITQITETSTCAYVVDFESRELCKHPEFQAKTSNLHHIQCQPIAVS